MCSRNLCFSLSLSLLPPSDIEVLKPGCGGVPTFDHSKRLQMTLLFMSLASVLFLLACAVRMGVRLCRPPPVRPGRPGHGDDSRHQEDEIRAIDGAGEGGGDGIGKPPLSRVNSLQKSAHEFTPLQQAEQVKAHRAAQISAEYLDTKQHMVHSQLILLVIFYLRCE